MRGAVANILCHQCFGTSGMHTVRKECRHCKYSRWYVSYRASYLCNLNVESDLESKVIKEKEKSRKSMTPVGAIEA